MGDFLVYGATGYTGRLIAEHAVRRGLNPVLAGRDAGRVGQLADRLHLRHRAFDLGSHRAVVDGLAGMTAVLHAAGPFSATSAPMAEACLAAGLHYCDITGEIDVFESLAARDAQAQAAGVMLMRGVGFDVVPSDCLAAHVAARLPDATRLRLSIGGLTRASRGTAKTMVEAVAQGVHVRSNGRLVLAAGTPGSVADFGAGPRPTVGVSWGDVSTAWHSTGIPNMEVFFEADRNMRRAAAMPGFVKARSARAWRNAFSRRRSIDAYRPAQPLSKEQADVPSSSLRLGTPPASRWSAGWLPPSHMPLPP